jgi:hypothetical protein
MKSCKLIVSNDSYNDSKQTAIFTSGEQIPNVFQTEHSFTLFLTLLIRLEWN